MPGPAPSIRESEHKHPLSSPGQWGVGVGLGPSRSGLLISYGPMDLTFSVLCPLTPTYDQGHPIPFPSLSISPCPSWTEQIKDPEKKN